MDPAALAATMLAAVPPGPRRQPDRTRRPQAPRLVAALGPRLADADRQRPNRAPHRLPRAAARGRLRYRKRPRTIYLRRGLRRPRSVLLHELGHLFDLRVMNNGDRKRFRKVLGASKRRWWAGKIPLAEQFAEGYSFCARYSRIVSISCYSNYHYRPTRRQHAKVCALIVKAAGDRKRPAPPPQAPVVTRADPVPPPQPPPSTVPGSGGKPQATPTPAPAAAADPAADPDDLPAALSTTATSTTHAVVEVTFLT